MKKLFLLSSLCLTLVFAACSKDNTETPDPTPTPPPTPTPTEVAAPKEIKAYDGFLRTRIVWSQESDDDIAKTMIFWNNREGSATHIPKHNEQEGTVRDSIEIKEILEGFYTFEIVNYDAENNPSEVKTVQANVFGDDFIAELETRPIEDLSYDKKAKTATITWQADWAKGIGTEVTHTTKADEPAIYMIENDTIVTTIKNAEVDDNLAIRTLYCPENCIDTMYSATVNRVIEAAPIVLFAPSNTKGYDGYKRVKLMWEQQVESDLHKTTIVWGLTEDQMCEKVFNREVESGMQRDSIYIDLAEGDYTFILVNEDEEGNTTQPVEIKARAYGDEYVATLETRPVTKIEYDESNSRSNITFAAWDKGLDTELRYNRTNGQEVVATILNNRNTESCNNIGENVPIEICSRYCPENCIDTMRSAVITKYSSRSVAMKVTQLNVKNGMIGFLYGFWDSRKASIVNFLNSESPDFICLQELGYGSGDNDYYTYILSGMGSNYAGVKYERNTMAEGNAILYRKDKFDLIQEGRFWLCSTPDSPAKHSVTIGSKTYTAKYERIAVWGIFREKTTNEEFYITTAHLDNSNTESDKNSSDYRVYPIIWEQGQILINNTNARANYGSTDAEGRRPIVITGDMNCNYNEKPMTNFTDKGFKDSWDIAQSKVCPDPSCPRSTMSEAKSSAAQKPYSCFDHIFVGGGLIPTVTKHTIHPPKYEGVHLSDHNAVSVELKYTF